jgi:peptidoglycan-associated lipoprotein
MKTSFALALGLAVTMAFGLGGCASQAEKPETDVATTGPAPSTGPGPATGGTVREDDSGRPWDDPGSPIYQRVVYFDYDSSEIREEFVPLLQAHVGYLVKHPGTRVTLEGHTDERGTREYNLALGDERAQVVQRFMLADGVRSDQLATLSFGEEKPAAPGHGDSSWLQNRRVELAY